MFLYFAMDRRTHIMYPRTHIPILVRKTFVWIELYGPPSLLAVNPFHLEIHTIFVLFFWKVQVTCGKKLETLAERKFKIRGLKNKVVLYMGKWSTLWLYFLKGWHPPKTFLLVEVGSIFLKASYWHLKLKWFLCTEVKGKFQSGAIVYTVHFLIIKN